MRANPCINDQQDPRAGEDALAKLCVSAGCNIDIVLCFFMKAMQNMLKHPEERWVWRLTPRNSTHYNMLLQYHGAGELLETAGFERRADKSYELLRGPDARFYAVRSATKRRLAACRRRRAAERQDAQVQMQMPALPPSGAFPNDVRRSLGEITSTNLLEYAAEIDGAKRVPSAVKSKMRTRKSGIDPRGVIASGGNDRTLDQPWGDLPRSGLDGKLAAFSGDAHPIVGKIKQAVGGLEALQAVEQVLLMIRDDPTNESIRCVKLNTPSGKKILPAVQLLELAGFEHGKLITSATGFQEPYVILSQLDVDTMERVWAMLWWALHQEGSMQDPYKELTIVDETLQHILGAVFGAVVGDALGAALGVRDAHKVTCDELDKVMEMCGGGIWQLAPGQATNNAELLLCLATALGAKGDAMQFCVTTQDSFEGSSSTVTLPVDKVALLYLRWASSAPFRNETACNTAFSGLMDGAALHARAKSLNMKAMSNGALIRCLGLLPLKAARESPYNVAQLARTDASLSHPNPSVAEASATYVVAATDLVNNGGDIDFTLEKVQNWVEEEVLRKRAEMSVAQELREEQKQLTSAPQELREQQEQPASALCSSRRMFTNKFDKTGSIRASKSAKDSELSLPGGTAQIGIPLDITIISARGLRVSDMFDKSDPYCVLEVSGKPETRQHTSVARRCLHPEWNQQMSTINIDNGDVLEFSIWDEEGSGKDNLWGRCIVPSDKFLPHGFSGELVLEDTRHHKSFLRVNILAEQLTSLPLAKLRVTIMRARWLRKADVSGKGHPYCVLEIHGKPRSRFTTQVIPGTSEPNWCEVCEEVIGWVPTDTLVFNIYDEDRFASDELLGKAVICGSQIYPDGFEGDLRLTETVEGNIAVLNVKCEVLIDELRLWLVQALEGHIDEDLPFCNQLGEVDSVQIPFSHAFRQLRLHNSFEEAMREVLAGGGDASTNAAAVGGLVGAAVGIHGIPRHWVHAVLSCDTSKHGKQARPPEYEPSRLPAIIHQIYHQLHM